MYVSFWLYVCKTHTHETIRSVAANYVQGLYRTSHLDHEICHHWFLLLIILNPWRHELRHRPTFRWAPSTVPLHTLLTEKPGLSPKSRPTLSIPDIAIGSPGYSQCSRAPRRDGTKDGSVRMENGSSMANASWQADHGEDIDLEIAGNRPWYIYSASKD